MMRISTRHFFFLPIFIYFLLLNTLGTAQTSKSYYPKPVHAEWFKVLPKIDATTPVWAKTMYTDETNFAKIEEEKYQYYKSHLYEKNIHIQNYKHWFKIVSNHITDDGFVNLPDEREVFLESVKNRKNGPTRSIDTWTNIGPYETVNFDEFGIAESRPTQANIYCLGVAESNTNIVYASAETGGIFKTIDKGMNWFPVSESYAMGNMTDIKVDPKNENIVYACQGSQLYKTTDGGVIWSLIYTFSDVSEQLLISKMNTDVIYAATKIGIFKSTNAGVSWTNKFVGRFYDLEFKPETDDVLYVAKENTTLLRPEIHKSTDSGDTWTLMDNGYYTPSVPAEATVYGCKIGVTPADPNRIYAGIIANGKNGDNGWIGIYYSLDEGASWSEDSGFDGGPYEEGSDASTNWYVAGYSSGYHQGFYNFDIDISHSDPDRLWIGTIWYCESGNKGGNIEYIRGTRNLNMHADIQDIDVIGNEIWIASDGGINYSNDECQTTSTRMKGVYASDYWGFGQGWNEDTWVGGRYHNGNAAFHENYGAGKTLFLGGAEDATGYVNQFSNRKNYHSDVGGKLIPENFNQNAQNISNLGLYPTQSYFHFSYSEVEWDPRYANRVFVGRDNHLFISEDGGINFDTLFTFPNQTFGGTSQQGLIRRFEISRDDPNYIYAIVRYTSTEYRVFKSTDGGNSFIELSNPPITSGSWRELSICLNPFDKDEIWVASYNSTDGNKIFSSTDGGLAWTPRYTSTIAGQYIKDIIYQTSDAGNLVYALTYDNFFYFNIDDEVWTQLNDGLPVLHTGFMALPFYRDNKIRIASAKGIWEAEMVHQSKIQALAMVESDSIFCTRDTVRLESYSIAPHVGTTWLWEINPAPNWISDSNARNPKVNFSESGAYDVTLTVTDNNGNSDSITTLSMIQVENGCEVDSIAGKSLKTFENGDYLVADDVNLTNLSHFTVTGWWRPNGVQQAYAALFSDGDWCAHCENTHGLIFNYYGDKLWYKWPGEGNPWGSSSGMDIPLDEWSYVALVIKPSGATLYINNQKYTHDRVLNPGNISSLFVGYGHYSKSFKGDIDEVTVWDRALTDEEIYQLRHITKADAVESDPNLIAYYQFNKVFKNSIVLDNAGTNHGLLRNSAEINTSTVPVGKGKSQLLLLNDGQLNYNFDEIGTEIYVSECEAVDGKIVISRIDVKADTMPSGQDYPLNYWMINSYGSSAPLMDSIKISPSDTSFLNSGYDISNITLSARPENAEGPKWVLRSKALGIEGEAFVFDQKANINDRLQVGLSFYNQNVNEIDPGKPCEPDTVPGNLLVLPGNSGDYVQIPALNLQSNNVTMSAWVKSDGLQNSWAGIIFNRAGGTVAGISTANGDNELRYHWNGGEWGWSSGAYLPVDEWAHVALVIQPDSVKIYLNGQEYSRAVSHAIEEFDGETRIGNDATDGNRTFQGEIDEVCIWNRSLTRDEIRALRHLTKEDEIETDTLLMAYFQFNEENGKTFDKSGNGFNATFEGNTARIKSFIPVGGGSSEKFIIENSGTFTSDLTGVEIVFDGSGTEPNGEVFISRINVQPNILPEKLPVSKSYWVINNYGLNQNFSGLSDISFTDIGNTTPITMASSLSLHTRPANEIGVWDQLGFGESYNVLLGYVNFIPTSLNEFGQFTIDNKTGKGWIGSSNSNWNNPANWGDGVVPNEEDHIIIPANTPFQPVVNVSSDINSLNLMSDAVIKVIFGVLFRVK